jgi:mono/diheme cytochrome c family protein
MGAVQRAVLLAIILTPAGLGVLGSAPSRSPLQTSKPPQAGANGDVARGRYLAEEVARCYECHTPRDAQGDLERDRWLQGGAVWIRPVRPNPNWAERAPALAGLPSYTDAQAERILERGTGPEGETLRPPMHTYHLTPEDARAIIAYLRSLARAGGGQVEE